MESQNSRAMNRIILPIAMLLVTLITLGQQDSELKFSPEYYLQKSKKQETTGLILLVSSPVLIYTGIYLGYQTTDNTVENVSTLVAIGGVANAVIGFIYLGKANQCRKRAAQVALKFQNLPYPMDISIPSGHLTVSVRLNL